MHIEAIPIGPQFESGNIIEVHWSLAGLRVLVSKAVHTIEITEIVFPGSTAFRFMDEGDLINFRESGAFSSKHLLFEVKAGGWFESECKAGLFVLSVTRGKSREWFVSSTDECLSVITESDQMPLVREYTNA